MTQRIIEEYGKEALDGFMESFSITKEKVTYEDFSNSYRGEFESDMLFSKYCIEQLTPPIEKWVVIDYIKTWEFALQYDYVEYKGHYYKEDW